MLSYEIVSEDVFQLWFPESIWSQGNLGDVTLIFLKIDHEIVGYRILMNPKIALNCWIEPYWRRNYIWRDSLQLLVNDGLVDEVCSPPPYLEDILRREFKELKWE